MGDSADLVDSFPGVAASEAGRSRVGLCVVSWTSVAVRRQRQSLEMSSVPELDSSPELDMGAARPLLEIRRMLAGHTCTAAHVRLSPSLGLGWVVEEWEYAAHRPRDVVGSLQPVPDLDQAAARMTEVGSPGRSLAEDTQSVRIPAALEDDPD